MTNAVLLMLLTGVVWAVVGVLFGAAPSERNRLYSFFAPGNLVFLDIHRHARVDQVVLVGIGPANGK